MCRDLHPNTNECRPTFGMLLCVSLDSFSSLSLCAKIWESLSPSLAHCIRDLKAIHSSARLTFPVKKLSAIPFFEFPFSSSSSSFSSKLFFPKVTPWGEFGAGKTFYISKKVNRSIFFSFFLHIFLPRILSACFEEDLSSSCFYCF